MKNKWFAAFLLVFVSATSAQFSICAQGTAFTYQGRLNDSGVVPNGNYDFRFRLAADALGNNVLGSPILSNAVPVNGGLFTIPLDFGAGVFTGSNYWLQVDVKTNGAPSYTTLTPLQALAPAPYAIFASTASNLNGTISSANVSGSYANPVNLNNAANLFTGTFTGNGAGVSNVNAGALGGLAVNQLWKTPGNSNTVPGVDFLGTTDGQPLEFRVNNNRALQLAPTTNAPNFIGGDAHNFVAPGVYGAAIGGGGTPAYSGGIGLTNKVLAPFATIGGGVGNTASGNANGTNGDSATVGGGWSNSALGNNSTVAGGAANQTLGDNSTIGGGYLNTIQSNVDYSTISGGRQNTVQSNATYATISGGVFNTVRSNALYSTIAGGYLNAIQTNSTYSTIGGGHQNSAGDLATVGGGEWNSISNIARYATVAGGYFNRIGSQYGSVGGGGLNSIGTNSNSGTISGGYSHTIKDSSFDGTIGGGSYHVIGTNSYYATVAGGRYNTIADNAISATIGGGYSNVVTGSYGTVAGGDRNSAGTDCFAAGHRAKAFHAGSFVWGDSQDADFASSASDQFSIRAGGGVRFVTAGGAGGMTLDGQPVATQNQLINFAGRAGGNAFTGQQTITGGNVGIGTISPQTALHIRAGFGSQLLLQDDVIGHSWNIGNDNNDNLVFVPNTGVGGYIYRGNGSYFSLSDVRLKQDIRSLGEVLDRVLQLRPVSYHFRDEPANTGRSLGLIAQEVEPLFPEVVGEHDGFKALAYSELVPVVISALQELNQNIKSDNSNLREELRLRDAEIAQLNRRLESLEKRTENLLPRLDRTPSPSNRN
jgi:hypothetical protein